MSSTFIPFSNSAAMLVLSCEIFFAGPENVMVHPLKLQPLKNTGAFPSVIHGLLPQKLAIAFVVTSLMLPTFNAMDTLLEVISLLVDIILETLTSYALILMQTLK